MLANLKAKIDSKTARVSVVGLGYVGLPLALDLAKAGFSVTGFDVSEDRVAQINRAKSYIGDVSDSDLKTVVTTQKKFQATTDFSKLSQMDTVSICVPTPLGKTRDPDISYVLAVRDRIREHIHPQMLVILESTTYPGTTEEIFVPIVEETNLILGQNFFLAFSPERIDPGNQKFNLRNTPKVVGGMTPACTEMVVSLYQTIVNQVVPVTSARVAEMVKILENTYRAVNIGLVNEVAIMCKILGINTWEVIDAAATKPFGFTPFYPGPGLGGHCIPVDPHYLSWKLKSLNYTARFIDLAAEVNTGMPHHVVSIIADTLNAARKSVNGSNIILLGMAYKADVSDIRESPALDIYKLLEEKGAKVIFNDPFAQELQMNEKTIRSTELSPKVLADQDLVVITTFHSSYDMKGIVESAKAVVDTRNATKGIKSPKIVRL